MGRADEAATLSSLGETVEVDGIDDLLLLLLLLLFLLVKKEGLAAIVDMLVCLRIFCSLIFFLDRGLCFHWIVNCVNFGK